MSNNYKSETVERIEKLTENIGESKPKEIIEPLKPGYFVMSQKYRPVHNMVTGHLKARFMFQRKHTNKKK